MGKFSAFKLPLKSLGTGTHEFEYHLDKQFFTNMENSDIHGADLCAKLTVVYNGEYYTLDFNIEGNVVLICDRCLDDLNFPISATYHLVVKYGEDYNDEKDDVLEIPQSDSYLNVAYMIYDTVVLAIPIKHVHPMGKCNRQMSAMLRKHRARRSDDEDTELEETLIEEMDSMPDPQADQASDPRWDELRKLKDNADGGDSDE